MRILILYNARSGHKQAKFQDYLKALAERGAQTEMRVIGKKFNLKELLNDAANFDRIVVAGGDGTVSAAAGILQGTGIPIMAYPGGTANLLARNLNIPAHPEKLAEITMSGKIMQTDLGELEFIRYPRGEFLRRRFLKRSREGKTVKIYFAIMAGCGFAARLMSQAQPWKSKLGEAAYWVSAFFNLFPRRAKFRIAADGKETEQDGIGILIVNFEKIQFNLHVISQTPIPDGKMKVAVIKARSLFGLIPILWGAVLERFGFARPQVKEVMETYEASVLEVDCRPPLRLQFDGEVLPKAAAFKVRVLTGAASLLMGPAETVAAPEAAVKAARA